MDLIYMDATKADLGVIQDYTLDLAFGTDENDFECTIDAVNHCCQEGYFLYYEGTEYGGIVDDIYINTDADEITYHGRTWHGILNAKVLEPDAGEDYLVINGEANEMLAFLIARMGLEGLFRASNVASGVNIGNYKMNRYIGGYDGIRKMLRSERAKLKIAFKDGFVELSAVPIVDYAKDEQFDTDQISFDIKKRYHPINHIICLGKGDLAEREVFHLYADAEGNISETQVFFGIDEVAETYENVNAESNEELRQGGIDRIKESWNGNEVAFDFSADDYIYDVGDIVGAKERMTGIEVNAEITKKIIIIKNNETTISYKVGE